jgi:hypothetical protein
MGLIAAGFLTFAAIQPICSEIADRLDLHIPFVTDLEQADVELRLVARITPDGEFS